MKKILSFWFGRMQDGWPVDDRRRLWFGGRNQDDRQMLESFGQLIDRAVAGDLRAWQEERKGCMALILLADQMTRATGRGSRRAFAGDRVALAASRGCIESGMYLGMPTAHRIFSCMPLMHSENMDDQDLCVKMFESLVKDCGNQRARIEPSLKYAIMHRDIVRKFGRFPHRNRALRRASTEDEREYLASNPHGFGQ